MVCGDRVVLTAELSLGDDGQVIYEGARGMVVGGQGLEGVVVSWDGPPMTCSVVPERSLRNANRSVTRAEASPRIVDA